MNLLLRRKTRFLTGAEPDSSPDDALSKGILTSKQVCQLAGITYRQLDYWARQGIAAPSVPARGSGSKRLYSAADFGRVVRVATLIDASHILEQTVADSLVSFGYGRRR